MRSRSGAHDICLSFGANVAEFPFLNQVALLQATASLIASGLHTARIDYERHDASRAKDKFLSMLEHELRNPLTPMVNALDLIFLKGSGPLAKEHAILDGRSITSPNWSMTCSTLPRLRAMWSS